MAKELTNRQLSEILGYALERAEKNINQSVNALERERKRIETFKVDTNSVEKIFKEADANFKESLRIHVSELRKLQESKPKWLQMKDWLLTGSLVLLIVTIGGLAGSFYYKLNKVEEDNKELENIVDNVSTFFREHPKDAEIFKEWNKRD